MKAKNKKKKKRRRRNVLRKKKTLPLKISLTSIIKSDVRIEDSSQPIRIEIHLFFSFFVFSSSRRRYYSAEEMLGKRLLILRTPLNRCLSTSATFFQQAKSPLSTTSSLVTPPIPVFGIEGRYASALFSAASKQNQLTQIDADFQKLDRLLTENKIMADFFRNPGVTREQRLAFINELGLSDMTKAVIETLVDNRREKKLGKFVSVMNRLMAANRGELLCRVITAKPLDDKSRNELDTVLKQFSKKGEKITVETTVDPSIMGGMIVEIGDRYIDMSIASKIKTYTDILTTNV